MNGTIQAKPTKRGVRISQHGIVLSEILRQPGPTHSVADVLAAVIHALSPGPRVAVLGFAGGGLVGPLRAMGCEHRVSGLDLDDSGYAVFQKLCGSWAGNVRFEKADVMGWLTRHCRGFDAVVEDLSVGLDGDVHKPAETWSSIPSLVGRRLNAGGIAVFNLLPPINASWKAGVRWIGAYFPRSLLVHLEDYENRLLISGPELPAAREVTRLLRTPLRRINSRLASRISVRSPSW